MNLLFFRKRMFLTLKVEAGEVLVLVQVKDMSSHSCLAAAEILSA